MKKSLTLIAFVSLSVVVVLPYSYNKILSGENSDRVELISTVKWLTVQRHILSNIENYRPKGDVSDWVSGIMQGTIGAFSVQNNDVISTDNQSTGENNLNLYETYRKERLINTLKWIVAICIGFFFPLWMYKRWDDWQTNRSKKKKKKQWDNWQNNRKKKRRGSGSIMP
jgi:hypothetical protein